MDAKQVWRAALGELQVSLSPANFETWLKDTVLVAVDDNHFRIAVPNGFAKDWLESRYRSLISQTLARVVGYSVIVEFEVREFAATEKVEPDPAPRELTVAGSPVAADRPAPSTPAPATVSVRVEPGRVGGPEGSVASLNPRYTFRTFIV